MSWELQKENKMLRDYVAALEGENRSRNQEKDLLLRQIQNLVRENDALRNELFRLQRESGSIEEFHEINRSRNQLQMSLDEARYNLENTLIAKSNMQAEIGRLKRDLQNAQTKAQTSSTSTLHALQINRLSTQNNLLKQKNEQLLKNQAQFLRLKKQNEQLKRKQITDNSIQVQTSKLNEQKERQLANLKEKLYKQFQMQKQMQLNELKRQNESDSQVKQKIIGDLRAKLTELQLKVQSDENSSSAEVRQLRISKAEMESKITQIQREKQNLTHRVRELELELTNKNTLLSRKNQEGTQLQRTKHELGRKLQQISQSSIIIEALRQNVAILQNKVKALENTIDQYNIQAQKRNRQSQDQKYHEVRTIQARYQLELDQLKIKLRETESRYPRAVEEEKKVSAQKERENEELKKIIKELIENNKNLLTQIKSNQQIEYNTTQRQNKNQDDLRHVIESLKSELSQVRTQFRKFEGDNKKMHEMLNSRSLSNSDVKEVNPSHMTTFRRKRGQQPANQTVSPRSEFAQRPYYDPNINRLYDKLQDNEDVFKVKHIKLRSPTEKYYKSNFSTTIRQQQQHKSTKSINPDKWQNLQKRIIQLREQNDQLKQSLFS